MQGPVTAAQARPQIGGSLWLLLCFIPRKLGCWYWKWFSIWVGRKIKMATDVLSHGHMVLVVAPGGGGDLLFWEIQRMKKKWKFLTWKLSYFYARGDVFKLKIGSHILLKVWHSVVSVDSIIHGEHLFKHYAALLERTSLSLASIGGPLKVPETLNTFS